MNIFVWKIKVIPRCATGICKSLTVRKSYSKNCLPSLVWRFLLFDSKYSTTRWIFTHNATCVHFELHSLKLLSNKITIFQSHQSSRTVHAWGLCRSFTLTGITGMELCLEMFLGGLCCWSGVCWRKPQETFQPRAGGSGNRTHYAASLGLVLSFWLYLI